MTLRDRLRHAGFKGFQLTRPRKRHAVDDGGVKRVRVPMVQWTGRDHVGVAGENDQRFTAPTPCPEVVDVIKAQALHLEANGFQSTDHQVLAALVFRRHRRPTNKLLGQFEGRIAHGAS